LPANSRRTNGSSDADGMGDAFRSEAKPAKPQALGMSRSKARLEAPATPEAPKRQDAPAEDSVAPAEPAKLETPVVPGAQ
jgi:hypothetical protein